MLSKKNWGAILKSALLVMILLGFGQNRAVAIGQHVPSDKAAKLEAIVTHYEKLGYLNGAVLVAEHGKVIYERGVGLANFEENISNCPSTKFDIASITKQFTAALVYQQAEKGKIRLEGTVRDYLPWYRKDTGSRMTIEQLIHHTSGLPADFDNPQFSDGQEALLRTQPILFAKAHCQPVLAAEPGTRWAYSNCGYLLLGLILEQVTGESYAELLQKQILSPLGMKNTGLDQNNLIQKSGAVGYTRHAGPRYSRGPDLDRGRIYSAGAIYSTVDDLYRWNQALSSDVLFSKTVRTQMFKPALENWAGGWFMRESAGIAFAQMFGDMPGNYFASITRFRDNDAVIIVLRNGYGSAEHLEENLQSVLFGETPILPKKSVKDTLGYAMQTVESAADDQPVTSGAGLAAVALLILVRARRAGEV